MIRTVIIDDEESAVNVLCLLLKKRYADEVEIIATTQSPFRGIELIRELKPDLVFLDIEMPGMTGIELIRKIEQPGLAFVFVTAHDSYALEAFRLSAVNYILKPLGPEAIVDTIERVKAQLGDHNNEAQKSWAKLSKLLDQYSEENFRIGIAMANKIVFVPINEILYCEANGSYTHLFLQDGSKLVSSKLLADFEEQLAPRQFFRIHHSLLINIRRVREFQRTDGGYVVLDNGTRLEVSQRRRKDFLQVINRVVI